MADSAPYGWLIIGCLIFVLFLLIDSLLAAAVSSLDATKTSIYQRSRSAVEPYCSSCLINTIILLLFVHWVEHFPRSLIIIIFYYSSVLRLAVITTCSSVVFVQNNAFFKQIWSLEDPANTHRTTNGKIIGTLLSKQPSIHPYIIYTAGDGPMQLTFGQRHSQPWKGQKPVTGLVHRKNSGRKNSRVNEPIVGLGLVNLDSCWWMN